MPEASFPVEVVGGVPVVTAPEEIDITNAAGLRAALLQAAAHGSGTLVVDMSRTQFCDSAGLNVLVRAHKRAQAEGGEVLLVICRRCRPAHLRGHRHRPPDPQLPRPGPGPRASARCSRFPPARRAGCRACAARSPGNPGDPLMTSPALLGTAEVLLVEDAPRRRAADQGSLRPASSGCAVARRRQRRGGDAVPAPHRRLR